MSKDLLLSDVRIPPIKSGIARVRALCGDKKVNLVLPISEFRDAIALGQRALDEFDAGREVRRLRG